MPKITNHGIKRLKSRTKVSSSDREEYIKEDLNKGLLREQCKGNLKRFVDKKCITYPGTFIRLYNNSLYIFESGSHKFITVYPLPGNLIKTYHQIIKKVSN